MLNGFQFLYMLLLEVGWKKLLASDCV
jgi:hypothetical protein